MVLIILFKLRSILEARMITIMEMDFTQLNMKDRAKSWAALNGDPSHSIVNKYELDLNGLNVLDLADFGVPYVDC